MEKKLTYFKENIQIVIMALPALLLTAVFSYWPMYGIILAFKNYTYRGGIWGSKWVGFKNFEFFFKSDDLWRVLRNTLGLEFLFIALGLVAAVGFALLMFELKKPGHVKTYQTISILPYFLSWVVVSYMVYALLEHNDGLFNRLLIQLGLEPVAWYSEPNLWPAILSVVRLWHNTGMSCIIYYASLMSMDSQLMEAAELDGASKWQRIRFVALPHLVPIVTIKTIMSIGGIFRSDFGMFYNVPRNLGILYPTTDVIDTYVYRALMGMGNVGMSTAVGLFQSVVCFATLMITNAIVKKISPENTLF